MEVLNMKNQKSYLLVTFAALVVLCLQTVAFSQTESKLASISGGGSVRWDVVANSGLTLIVSSPDGRTFRKEYKATSTADFALVDKQGERLPDGTYTYELRLAPPSPVATKGRGNDDASSEDERTGRKRAAVPVLTQSGSFSIINGSAVVAGAVEDNRRAAKVTQSLPPAAPSGNTVARLFNHRMSLRAAPDDVIPDDLIVQGSACVGLDCVNGEVFGFDTIRLKENNTRLQFDDTSTSAGFPTNNWQIRANSSASGGDSFLGFVDQGSTGNSETGTIVLQVNAGAPANSVKVASNGKVGFRTATPVLDLHITTSDTPAHRLEQTNAGGFTAQTWDIAGNEANFFVRDVTGGSRLPFRIRPGAPTSSVDISASGNVGIGTASPAARLDVESSTVDVEIARLFNSSLTSGHFVDLTIGEAVAAYKLGRIRYIDGAGNAGSARFSFFHGGDSEGTGLTILGGGNVGIGTIAPTANLSVNGTANKPGGGSWDVFSDERLKNIKGNFNSGLKAVMQLQPIRYQYRKDNALGLKSDKENVGFGAQSLQKIIPEAVTKNSEGYLMVNNDPILWTMLNAIKEQQKEIAELKGQVQKLRAASHRRRR
jgi:hypothetical protein